MKKIILTVAAVFAMTFANAQEVKFGVKGGLNVSNLTGDIEDSSSKIGFNVGGFVEIKITDKFAFQPELLFSTQGVKSNYEESFFGETQKTEDTYKLNYLNIPLMAKYYVAEGFSLEAGPQIGFLMSAKDDYEATTTSGGESVTVSSSDDIKNELKSLDFGFNFGAGYDFTENISAGIRYNLGLSSINKESDFELKNNVISIGVGYKF